jgi:hypothetical protein
MKVSVLCFSSLLALLVAQAYAGQNLESTMNKFKVAQISSLVPYWHLAVVDPNGTSWPLIATW